MGRDEKIQRTHVGLYDYQIEWGRDNNINMSAELRELLDERMPEEAKP